MGESCELGEVPGEPSRELGSIRGLRFEVHGRCTQGGVRIATLVFPRHLQADRLHDFSADLLVLEGIILDGAPPWMSPACCSSFGADILLTCRRDETVVSKRPQSRLLST